MGVFFFQAEDGIRDLTVTGVQTCALPILFSLCTCNFAVTPAALVTLTKKRRVPSCSNSGFAGPTSTFTRSEEHTSELQSQSNLVCRLLLEKKKTLRPNLHRKLEYTLHRPC